MRRWKYMRAPCGQRGQRNTSTRQRSRPFSVADQQVGPGSFEVFSRMPKLDAAHILAVGPMLRSMRGHWSLMGGLGLRYDIVYIYFSYTAMANCDPAHEPQKRASAFRQQHCS